MEIAIPSLDRLLIAFGIFALFLFLLAIGCLVFVISYVRKDDPVKNCPVFKDEGCAHVDGMLCDFPECDMIDKYKEDKLQNTNKL